MYWICGEDLHQGVTGEVGWGVLTYFVCELSILTSEDAGMYFKIRQKSFIVKQIKKKKTADEQQEFYLLWC